MFNYLYHVVLARVLGPAQYGDLAALLNVTWLWLLPGPVVTLVYTRIGRRQGRAGRVETGVLWGSGVVLWGLVWAVAEPLVRLLHVSALLFVLFTLEVVPSLALAANQGALQRARRFEWVGAVMLLNNGFRVVAAAGAAWAGLRLAALGVLEGVAAWCAWGLSAWAVARLGPHQGESGPATVAGTAVVGTLTALWALLDGLLAKHALGAHAAGLYNGLATIGHSVQYVSGSLGVVMMTNILARPSQRVRFFTASLGVYAAVAACFFALVAGWAPTVVRLILSPHFLPVASFLVYYGWGMIALGFLNLILLYAVAVDQWSVLLPAAGGMAIWVAVLWRTDTLSAFVGRSTAVLVATWAGSAAWMAASAWRRRWVNRAPVR